MQENSCVISFFHAVTGLKLHVAKVLPHLALFPILVVGVFVDLQLFSLVDLNYVVNLSSWAVRFLFSYMVHFIISFNL